MILNRIITLSNGKKIAEFKNDYQLVQYNCITNKWEWTRIFRLDKENLEIRIATGKKYNLDTSVEESALFQLTD